MEAWQSAAWPAQCEQITFILSTNYCFYFQLLNCLHKIVVSKQKNLHFIVFVQFTLSLEMIYYILWQL